MGAFVGRTDELSAIAGQARAVRAGRSVRAVFLFGAPGSGKSRTIVQVAPLLDELGRLSVVGYEPERDVPLSAASSMLRTLAAVPGTGERLDSVLFGPSSGGGIDRLRVFDAAWQSLAASHRRVVVVDDVQWLDANSTALLHYVLRNARESRRPLLLLIAGRDVPAARSFEADVREQLPDEAVVGLELGPLDDRDADRLVRGLAPNLTEAEVHAICAAADGSPFWLEALVRSRPGNATLPSLIRSRLQGLGSDAREVLGLLAVAARPMAPADAASALAWPTDRLEAAAGALVDRGLCVDSQDGIRLSHDLIRDSALAALPGERRRAYHAAVARLLAELPGDDVGTLREALGHELESGRTGDALALRLARCRRRRLLDAEDLRVLAEIADSATEAELGVAVARLAMEIGLPELALERWQQVRILLGSADERARAALEASRLAILPLGQTDRAVRLLDLARSEPVESAALAIDLDVHEALLRRHVLGDRSGGRAEIARALDAVRALIHASSDRVIPADVRDAYINALSGAYDVARLEDDDAETMLALAEEQASATPEADASALLAHFNAAMALRALGRWRDAVSRFERLWADAERWSLPAMAAESGYWLADSLRVIGDWDRATSIATETIALGRRVQDRRAISDSEWVLRLIALSRGDARSTVGSIERELAGEDDPHYRIEAHDVAAAWLARIGNGNDQPAVLRHEESARTDAESIGCTRCRLESLLRGAEIRARAGDTDGARALLATWQRAVVHRSPVGEFRFEWAEGLIAFADHDAEGAASILGRAADDAERMHMTSDGVWVRLDEGRAAASTADPGAAVEVFEQASAMAQRLDARTELAIASSELRSLGVRSWRRGPSARGIDPRLRGRPRDVARLVARGATNPEIAAALLLSRKTVESHVSTLLARYEVRNRTELARRLAEAPGLDLDG